MVVEDAALLEQIVAGPHGTDCELDPEGSPAGPAIRVLFDAPFLGQDAGTGVFANTAPQAYARQSDVAGVSPEETVLRIEGRDFVAARAEAVAGGNWRLLILREVA